MDISRLEQLGVARGALSDSEIEGFLQTFGLVPPALLDLYRKSNGFQTINGIGIYGAEDLAERNETFEVSIYSQGYCLIGDDSGGRGFLMSVDGSSENVFVSDLGDLDPEDFEPVSDSLQAWINVLG